MAIRVIIADDHPIVLDGLAQLFAAEDDIEVVSRCSNGDEALSAVRRARADVLVLDLRMSGRDGLEVMRAMSQEGHAARVVLFAGQLNDGEVLAAMSLGVAGIVPKRTAAKALLHCVRRVAAGERCLDSTTVQAARESMLQREKGLNQVGKILTRRELDIVRMVSTGARNKEIAAKLGISEGTVKMHLHTIYEKLCIPGRVALSIYAREQALV